MKYYQLTKDLPTFKKGQMFYINDFGSLVSKEDGVVAYSESTLAKFPNILKDWFREVSAPERDSKTKREFIGYLSDHKEERFFQAVCNFARRSMGDEFNFIYASAKPLTDYIHHYDAYLDTFYLECDAVRGLVEGEGGEEDSEEQRADER